MRLIAPIAGDTYSYRSRPSPPFTSCDGGTGPAADHGERRREHRSASPELAGSARFAERPDRHSCHSLDNSVADVLSPA